MNNLKKEAIKERNNSQFLRSLENCKKKNVNDPMRIGFMLGSFLASRTEGIDVQKLTKGKG